MKNIWAPWRIGYIKKTKQSGCIFCQAKKDKKDRNHFVLVRGKKSFSILNLYPYNNGHFLICPNRHIKDIEELDYQEVLDMFNILLTTKKIITKILKPQGFNIGINCGRISGAGIINHLHIHVVPRWSADTNFMPVVADTKIVSQSLKELFDEFKNNLKI